jgi:uncharacterized repeat protein (TIGR03803 family)
MMKYFVFLTFLISSLATAQYTNLHNFPDTINGRQPLGDLVSDGIYLYGMTGYGGINDAGTIFKILPDGTGYTKIFDFGNGTDGKYPKASLFFDGTYLYGTTFQGGTNMVGVIFKILPNGTGYTNILDFANLTGNSPTGSLISDGTFLYGMANLGGANGKGTIFKIMPDGSGFDNILDFAGPSNGEWPYGPLLYDGTFLYGTTTFGGINGAGVIFKIMPDGSGYVNLFDFDGTTGGTVSYGGLTTDGTFLYGMTIYGGPNTFGTIFKIMTNGTGFTTILDLDGTNGKWPHGSLIYDGGFLYGMTSSGGTSNLGNVFKILPDGTGYLNLLNFSAVDGYIPYGNIMSDGTYLYGMTSGGFGSSLLGTIFRYQYSFVGLDEMHEQITMQVYPNPTTGTINIVSETDQKNVMIEISDMTGRTVMTNKYADLSAGESYVMDVSMLNNGSYILRINNNQIRIIKK